MLCICSIGSNNKPSAEEVEACNNTSSFSLTLYNLRWARQKPQEYIQRQYTHVIRFNVASGVFVWFLSWHHRVKLEKNLLEKLSSGGKKKKSNFDRAVRQSHLLPLQRVFHIVQSHHQSPRSSSQIDPWSLCPRMTPTTVIIREWSATYCRAHFVVEH